MVLSKSERTAKLLSVLEADNISDKEYSYRKQQLELAENEEGIPISPISDRYYNLAHEIKSYAFLKSLGSVILSCDVNHTPGCDLDYKEKYQIECVCASAGKYANENGLTELCQINIVTDYNSRKAIINSRITTVLAAKVDFYEKHMNNDTISKNQPYIIFLGLGSLAMHTFAEENGIALTDVLLGRGYPTVTINQNNKIVNKGYTHNEFFPKPGAPTSPINCNLFCSPSFRCVSGILFSDALLDDSYNTENTWLFINPFADIPINPNDFPGVTYWAANEDNCEYRSHPSDSDD